MEASPGPSQGSAMAQHVMCENRCRGSPAGDPAELGR